jgi:molybdenum cofactor synthesis domain-containing protein
MRPGKPTEIPTDMPTGVRTDVRAEDVQTKRAGLAAILAIGTELTDGQVVNSNAASIANWLAELNVKVVEHRSVPDEREAMRSALRDLLDRVQVLVVCGGLGPTADDFTREVLAEVVDLQLVWDDRSDEIWLQIVERLQRRGVTPQENQKKQAWFPKGARIFPNQEGTAAGFALIDVPMNGLSDHPRYVLALPGPPHEVAHLWKTRVRADLEAWIRKQGWPSNETLMVWRTLGRGEGSLDAELEPALSQWAGELRRPRPQTGYRAHAPYVDLKLWLNKPWQGAEVDAWMTARFGLWMIQQSEEQLIERVLTLCSSKRVWDRASSGRWLRRLLGASPPRGRNVSSPSNSIDFDYFMSETEPNGWDYAIEFDASTQRVSWRSQRGEMKSAQLPELAGLWPSERHGVWIAEVALLLAAGESLPQLQSTTLKTHQ